MADLPAPVGITTSVSVPATTLVMASSCPGRSSGHPKTCRASCCALASIEDVIITTPLLRAAEQIDRPLQVRADHATKAHGAWYVAKCPEQPTPGSRAGA